VTEPYLGHDLIFIVSLPRSGSTLLQRLLAGHPEVGAASEPWLLLHPAYGRRSTGIVTEYDADWAALAVNEFLHNYTDGDSAYDDGVRAFAQAIYRNAMQRAGVTRFIDKTPRYVMILDELQRWFPAARFVFLLRHPLAVLASIVNTQVNHDLTSLERFRNELLRGPQALVAGMQARGQQASVVRYEQLVAAPEDTLRALCTELGLEFQPDMLDYAATATIKGRMQDRTGVNQHSRPVTGREAGWRQLLADRQQLEFAQGYLRELGPELFRQLGYDFDEVSTAVGEAAARLPPANYVYPWEVALLTPQQKRGRDQLHVDRCYAYRRHGVWMARLIVAKAWWGGVLAAIRYARRHGSRNFAVREDLGPR